MAEDCEPFGPSEEMPHAPHDESARFPWEREDPTVAEDFDLDRIISGGPPPDGIPSIDEPCFEPIAAGDRWLKDRSPVMTVDQGYEDRGSSFLFDGPTDDRLPPNSRVVGLTGPDDGDPVAVALAHLREQRTVEVDVAGDPIVVLWAPGKASALDTSDIDEGRDVGQTGSFRPTGPEGRHLTFQASEEDEKRFVDEQTGSTWTVAGNGERHAGPLRARSRRRR